MCDRRHHPRLPRDTPANLGVYQRGGGYQGGTGYPLARVLALVACGTRTIIDATFGTDRIGETTYAHHLVGALHPGMIMLADRNFAARDLLGAVADTGADLLVRVKIGRNLPACRRLPDRSYISRIGELEVRVSTATITVVTDTGRRSEAYRLVTTVRDQLTAAMGVLTDTATGAVVDLVGVLGRNILDHLIPDRRSRTNPRVVKRAISVTPRTPPAAAPEHPAARPRSPSTSSARRLDHASHGLTERLCG